MAQTTWILQLCYPWGTTLRVPPLGRQWHTRTSGLPGRFRWSHGGGRLLVACLFRGETGGGSLAEWVFAPHCAHPARCRCGGAGETVVGSSQGCQGERPDAGLWRSRCCVLRSLEVVCRQRHTILGPVGRRIQHGRRNATYHYSLGGAPPPSVLLGPMLPLIFTCIAWARFPPYGSGIHIGCPTSIHPDVLVEGC